MLQKTSLPSIPGNAGVLVLDEKKLQAHMDAELARQQHCLWRLAHQLHPLIAKKIEWVGYAIVLAAFALLLGVMGQEYLAAMQWWQFGFWLASVLTLFFFGMEMLSADNRHNMLHWQMTDLDTYRTLLNGPVPLQAENIIDKIRAQTDAGVFRIAYVGCDPVLYIGEPWKDEFGPEPLNLPLLVWDKFGKVIEL